MMKLIVGLIFFCAITAYVQASDPDQDGAVFLANYFSQFGGLVQPDKVKLNSAELKNLYDALNFLDQGDDYSTRAYIQQFYKAIAKDNAESQSESVQKGLSQMISIFQEFNPYLLIIFRRLDQDEEYRYLNRVLDSIMKLIKGKDFINAGKQFGQFIQKLSKYQMEYDSQFCQGILEGYFAAYGIVDKSKIRPNFNRYDVYSSLYLLTFNRSDNYINGSQYLTEKFFKLVNANHAKYGGIYEIAAKDNEKLFGNAQFLIQQKLLVEKLSKVNISEQFDNLLRLVRRMKTFEAGVLFGQIQKLLVNVSIEKLLFSY
eukprot:TRINITY_DN631_c0_g1_i14.p1 TRINITY_DN631_c0_g1~~TRINITY_DN631_c0_g1_i14.p1  ORF type:complete len:315 (+),score=14.78 TRINITY_DN631_c0_g1_i14:130-1074(+)